MDQLRSMMPPPEEIKALNTMTITTLLLSECKSTKARLNIDADGVPIETTVYEIDNEKVIGYLPSKVFWESDNGLRLLYYVSKALPQSAKPFGEKPVYCFYTLLENHTFEYDANWRVFIDQVATPGGVLLVVMFNHDLYNDIINKEI